MGTTFAKLAELPLQIESSALDGLVKDVSSGFERRTTIVRLRGGGAEGVGEDVVYDADEQLAFQQAGPPDLRGGWTLASLGARIDELDLFPREPLLGETERLYRRWAFHSAALDLALRQAGRTLHGALGIEPRPVTFVLSRRLGEPPALDELRALLERYPGLRLKLDATPSWDERLISELAELGAVDAVDFKAFYSGTVVDNPPDPALYRRVAEGLPDAWLEDPDISLPETDAALAEHRERITWDAPIHSVADIEGLAFEPQMVNIKPSRFGSLEALCAAYDHCAAHGIGAYGGGQFELGPGRGQAQYLASLFHPGSSNDLAPSGYNDPQPADGLPASPLAPAPEATGFRWQS